LTLRTNIATGFGGVVVNDTTYAVGVSAFGRVVLFLLYVRRFSPCEAKNDAHIHREYLAAAGYEPRLSTDRVSRVNESFSLRTG
jgi:hypothetical protein